MHKQDNLFVDSEQKYSILVLQDGEWVEGFYGATFTAGQAFSKIVFGRRREENIDAIKIERVFDQSEG